MRSQNWNKDWLFWEEKNAFSLVWSVPENARTVTLPHDAMRERMPNPNTPNSGDTGYRDGGNYVYVKRFYAPEEYRGQTVILKFEGVYQNALVYCNGHLAGKRPYGYAQFYVPLNDCLRYGGENELRVLVKNAAMPNSRWYSGSGIYRDVWLLTGDTAYLPDGKLHVVTRWTEADSARVAVSVEVRNRGLLPRELALEVELFAPDGRSAACTRLPLTLPGGGAETVEQSLTVAAPALWSAGCPALYRCAVRLMEGEWELDRAECEFGIRTLQLDARSGLRVNGQPVKLRGACIHHDNGLLGAVSLDQAELRRVRILKEAGFNAIRSAHNPASEALLRACDRLGMYVMDEAFDMWTRPKKDCDYSLFQDKWWREDVTAMVEKDYNHPCVVLYSLGNEIPEAGLPGGSALGREMARQVRELDWDRFVMVSLNGVFAAGDCVDRIMADVLAASPEGNADGNVNDFMSAMDSHMDDIVTHPLVSARIDAASAGMDLTGYNYMTARYEPDAAAYPQRVVVGSETYPPQIARNWALVERLPSVIGDFTWTGWDYIGEAGVGIPAYHFGEGGFGAQYPCQLAYCGDIDITGFRRPASYFREIVFGLRKAPYITVQDPAHYGQPLIKTPWVISDSRSAWNWDGFEGKPVVVEVYAPGDEVELFQDGVSLGRRPAGPAAGYTALFETVYRPGTLLAVAYAGGEELGRMELITAGPAVELALEAEPDQKELIYVNLDLLDERGRPADGPDRELTVELSGPGTLAGLGSGDPKPVHNYNEQTTRTFHGRALAILRRIGEGELQLSVDAGDGLRGSLTIS